jgi:hypothetical protein
VTSYRFSSALTLLVWLMLNGTTNVRAMPSPMEVDRAPFTVDAISVRTKLAQTQPAQSPPQAPTAPTATPADTQATTDEPIGNVATLTGSATVIRNKNSLPLKLKDDIHLNDVLRTSAASTLGITFNDATTFNLTANARITIDNYIYEDGGKQNTALFDITKGTVAFVAAAVAKTGDMKITTPTATLGIRGTTGLVEVPEGAAATSANNVAIKLYPDPDGRVGRIEVNDRAGARLGFLTQGTSGFTIRPGAGGRLTAAPLQISPQQALRDQGVVRQVHAAQNVGRQIVTEQRAFRRANPGLVNPNRGNAPRQPGPQRQNGLPGQNRPGQPQPGAPNRQGLQPQPGSPKQPGQPPQPGQRSQQGAQPGAQPQPGVQPRPGQNPQQRAQPGAPPRPALRPRLPGGLRGAPGLQRPGLPNRPLFRRPALPKGKKERR